MIVATTTLAAVITLTWIIRHGCREDGEQRGSLCAMVWGEEVFCDGWRGWVGNLGTRFCPEGGDLTIAGPLAGWRQAIGLCGGL